MSKFKGADCSTKADVEAAQSVETMKIIGNQGDQLKLMGEMVALLMAYQGVIGFDQAGVEGVTDEPSARAYILNILAIKWLPILSVRQEAEQFIMDNDLK